MVVLGVHDSNLSSACLLIDGRIVAAVAEERLSRKKGTGRFPRLAIRQVLSLGGVTGRDVDVVAMGMKSSAFDTERAQISEYRWEAKLASGLSRVLPLSLLAGDRLSSAYVAALSPLRRWRLIKEHGPFLADLDIALDRIRFYDHHTCHAAVAYYNRPWNDGAAVFTCDGEGDGYSGTVWVGEDASLRRVGTVTPANSIGSLYSRVTRCLGMTPWRDEHKVMGLAGYCDGAVLTPVGALMRDWVELEGLRFRNRTGRLGDAFRRWASNELLGFRFDETAAGLQRLLEETLAGWVARNLRHYGQDKVALGGGVFLNVKANKRIAELPQVRDLFVFPAAADDSASVGAAMLGYRELAEKGGRTFKWKPLDTLYLGPPALEDPAGLREALAALPYAVRTPDDVEDAIAELLAAGEIVARCSGRAELGPRALGNRSILAHPGRMDLVQELNAAVKHRDFWMPFAPALLAEEAATYLVNPKSLKAPHMILAFDTKPECRNDILGTIHQGDHTSRPQILERTTNPSFYRIIELFRQRTGLGAVLNTSFNLHGEPVVSHWRDAIDTFGRSGLRHLVIENYLISKDTD